MLSKEYKSLNKRIKKLSKKVSKHKKSERKYNYLVKRVNFQAKRIGVLLRKIDNMRYNYKHYRKAKDPLIIKNRLEALRYNKRLGAMVNHIKVMLGQSMIRCSAVKRGKNLAPMFLNQYQRVKLRKILNRDFRKEVI